MSSSLTATSANGSPILREAGLSVERHGDHFGPAATDEEWLETVGREGWIAITHDARIRYKPNELAAVMTHRVALLVVVGKAPFPDLARSFVATLPRIETFLEAHTAPFIAKVYRGQAPDDASPSTGRIECGTRSSTHSSGFTNAIFDEALVVFHAQLAGLTLHVSASSGGRRVVVETPFPGRRTSIAQPTSKGWSSA
jgi:PIN like domain